MVRLSIFFLCHDEAGHNAIYLWTGSLLSAKCGYRHILYCLWPPLLPQMEQRAGIFSGYHMRKLRDKGHALLEFRLPYIHNRCLVWNLTMFIKTVL